MSKSLSLYAGATLLLSLLAGCANGPASAEKHPTNPPHTNPVASQVPKLEKGMTAELIRQKLGAPDEIKPMPSPEGTAEVWIYHSESVIGTEQVTTGFREIPVFAMSGGNPVTINIKEPIYTLTNKVAVTTRTLLMFDGKLILEKSSVETRLAF